MKREVRTQHDTSTESQTTWRISRGKRRLARPDGRVGDGGWAGAGSWKALNSTVRPWDFLPEAPGSYGEVA